MYISWCQYERSVTLQITLYGHRLLQDCGSVVHPVKAVNENQILARKCTPKTKVFLNWKMYVENSSALGGYHTCDVKDNCVTAAVTLRELRVVVTPRALRVTVTSNHKGHLSRFGDKDNCHDRVLRDSVTP